MGVSSTSDVCFLLIEIDDSEYAVNDAVVSVSVRARLRVVGRVLLLGAPGLRRSRSVNVMLYICKCCNYSMISFLPDCLADMIGDQ